MEGSVATVAQPEIRILVPLMPEVVMRELEAMAGRPVWFSAAAR